MGLRMLKGTVEDAQAWIGRKMPPRVGSDPASVNDFRRKMEVHGFECAIHTDPEIARGFGYRDAVAPVSMIRPISTRAYWPAQGELSLEAFVPGPPIFEFVPGPGSRAVVTAVDTSYHAPVYPGDKIVSTSVVTDVTPKSTAIGDGIFLKVDTAYTKESSGELCASETLTFFRYDAKVK